jgi:diketogulonate reductase-like aldo/keto reductase
MQAQGGRLPRVSERAAMHVRASLNLCSRIWLYIECMRKVNLPNGVAVAALGLGTWRMGESKRNRATETAAVLHALTLGYRLIDTAEMYGEGGAEEVVGAALHEAITQRIVKRDDVFIVSKVYPHNASAQGVQDACVRSLARLGVECIDLYLLHWRSSHPLAHTVASFEALKAQGKIAHWGVSNFDASDMQELWSVPHGTHCAANQVYYSMSERGIEFDLLPWQRAHNIPTMAYCPIDQGTLAQSDALRALSKSLNAAPAQIALAWLMQQGDVIAIPKAVKPEHQRDNLAAANLTLSGEQLAQIDALFPPPKRKRRLAMT